VDWRRLGRDSHGHSSPIALTTICSSTAADMAGAGDGLVGGCGVVDLTPGSDHDLAVGDKSESGRGRGGIMEWGRATPPAAAGSWKPVRASGCGTLAEGRRRRLLVRQNKTADEALKLADHRGQSFSSSRLQVHAAFLFYLAPV
jgi:hypothetical protein